MLLFREEFICAVIQRRVYLSCYSEKSLFELLFREEFTCAVIQRRVICAVF